MSDCDSKKENISANGHARPRWLDIISFMRIMAVFLLGSPCTVCKIIVIVSKTDVYCEFLVTLLRFGDVFS